MPAVMGIALMLAAGATLAGVVTSGRDVPAGEPPRGGWRQGMLAWLALVGGTALVSGLGFAPGAFAIALGLMKLLGVAGWTRPLAVAVGLAAASQLVFALWLGVPLPTGLW